MRRFTKYASMVIFLLIVQWHPAFAQNVTKVGTTAAKFLSIPIGARSLAMGGAFVSVANDATAMYWNPSGIARMEKTELALIHSVWFADINVDYVGLVVPMGHSGSFGVNVVAMTMDDMLETTEFEPEGTGNTFPAGSFALGLTYARNLTDRFSIGANVKYIYESISNSNASQIAFDIGTLFTTPFNGIRFGASILNYGGKMNISGEDLLVPIDPDPVNAGNNTSATAVLSTGDFDLPLLLRIGVSKDVKISESNRLTLSADGMHPNDNTESVNFGAEYAMLNEKVFFRGGYNKLFLDESIAEFTLGGGLNFDLRTFGLKVDYAYQEYNYLSGIHNFSLNLVF